jgi:serine phosphatase RsbU (regulator of sigma subunit)
MKQVPQTLDAAAMIAHIDRLSALCEDNFGDDAKLIELSNEVIELSRQVHYLPGLVHGLCDRSAIQLRQGAYHEAILTLQEALPLAREVGDRQRESRVLNNFAVAFHLLGDYEAALDYYLQALTVAEESNYNRIIATTYYNIGEIYSNLEQYELAITYYKQGLETAQRLNVHNMILSCLDGLGDVYLAIGQLESALSYLQQSLDLNLAEHPPYYYLLCETYTSQAMAFEKMGLFEKALNSLYHAIQIGREQDFKAYLSTAIRIAGTIQSKQGQLEEAHRNLERALELAEESGAKLEVSKSYLALSELHEQIHEYQSALNYYRQYENLKNEILNAKSQEAIANRQATFNLERSEKEREIYRLRNVELAAANKQIATLNERLKSENMRMSAELEVTQRIQQMVLPNTEELAQFLERELEIAAFMLPATEVGGDYYDVLLQPDGHVKIAIGDVTGHGLESGVLMLMVQSVMRTLVDNLQQADQTAPSQVVMALNHTIYKNLQRMHSDKNLTLVLIDYQPDTGWIQVSGQHEEVLLVHSSDGSVEQLDTIDLGFPVGLIDDISDFMQVKSYQLAPDDVLVLYTDGVTEAENCSKIQYGLERLVDVLQTSYKGSASGIKQAIINDLLGFIGDGQKIFDDVTLLVLKHKM